MRLMSDFLRARPWLWPGPLFATAFAGPALAQMKVGSNPTTLTSDVNLQAEATDGSQVVVRKSTAQVGIGTTSPANRLEVNSGTASASGVRLTQLPSASFLGTNASGDIVKSTASGNCTCGQVTAAVVASLGGDWKLMNGSYSGGSCNAPVVNASNAVLVMGGTAGTTASATTIARNQLPSVVLSGSTSSDSAGTPSGSISTNSATTVQTYGVTIRPYGANQGNEVMTNKWNNIANGGSYDEYGYGYRNVTIPSHGHTFTGNALSNHAHTYSTPDINGGVTQQALSTANLPSLAVNWFICIN